MSKQYLREVAPGFVMVAVGLLVTAVLICCTANQARTGTNILRTGTQIVDVPTLNEQGLGEFLNGIDGRLATIEAAKPGERMNWQDWVFAILGAGILPTAAAAGMTARLNTARNKSRSGTVVPIVDAIKSVVDTLHVAERANVAPALAAATAAVKDAAVKAEMPAPSIVPAAPIT